MSTHQPPDLAAIRALCGKLADGPQHGADYALAAFEAAKALPALLSMITSLQVAIEMAIDELEAGTWHDAEHQLQYVKAQGLLG